MAVPIRLALDWSREDDRWRHRLVIRPLSEHPDAPIPDEDRVWLTSVDHENMGAIFQQYHEQESADGATEGASLVVGQSGRHHYSGAFVRTPGMVDVDLADRAPCEDLRALPLGCVYMTHWSAGRLIRAEERLAVWEHPKFGRFLCRVDSPGTLGVIESGARGWMLRIGLPTSVAVPGAPEVRNDTVRLRYRFSWEEAGQE